MARLVRHSLHDILSAIDRIDEFIRGCTFERYENDWLIKRAVERGVEIISEASRRLPQRMRDLEPSIAWKGILDVGNVLRHEYDDVVDRIIYDIATKELDALKAAILAIEASLDEPEE